LIEIEAPAPQPYLDQLSGLSTDELWQLAEAVSVGLTGDELARILLEIGFKHKYGIAAGVTPSRAQIAAFLRSLQLRDLALAHACALGRDAAWQQFMAIYKEPLTKAAIGVTRFAAFDSSSFTKRMRHISRRAVALRRVISALDAL